jgi:hypothetical protein
LQKVAKWCISPINTYFTNTSKNAALQGVARKSRKPKEVRGIKFRPDRGTWEAQYKAGGSRVRKNFLNHEAAVIWLETAKGLRHKEGVASLPSSAAEPLLTLAEKKELKEHRANSLLLGELCDQYLAHIQNPNNPERPKDQINPPQRVGAIKEAFGDRSAVHLEPHEIKDWLISLGLAAATLNRYKSTLSVCSSAPALARAWESAASRSHSATFFPAFAAAVSTSPNSVSVSRVAMDLAREVSFPETVDADGKVVSCGLSLPEAIQYATWTGVPLKRLDASTALSVSANVTPAQKPCPKYRCLQLETRKLK